MSTTLLSYSSGQYWLAQRALCMSGKTHGVDRCISLSRKDLVKTYFYSTHRKILDQARGGGYWLWKPYFILETLKQLQENDVLIYADAGIIFRKSIRPLVELTSGEQAVAIFYNDVIASHYTKRDVFVALHCDEPSYHNTPMIHAGLQVYRKTAKSIEFVQEVFDWCLRDRLITEEPNTLGLPNLPGFIEHRHDQSIFSVVAHKRKMTLFADPTQYRTRNVNFIVGTGDIPLTESSYHSVAYVHRYKNLQMWRLLADGLRKKMRFK